MRRRAALPRFARVFCRRTCDIPANARRLSTEPTPPACRLFAAAWRRFCCFFEAISPHLGCECAAPPQCPCHPAAVCSLPCCRARSACVPNPCRLQGASSPFERRSPAVRLVVRGRLPADRMLRFCRLHAASVPSPCRPLAMFLSDGAGMMAKTGSSARCKGRSRLKRCVVKVTEEVRLARTGSALLE